LLRVVGPVAIEIKPVRGSYIVAIPVAQPIERIPQNRQELRQRHFDDAPGDLWSYSLKSPCVIRSPPPALQLQDRGLLG